MGFHAYSSPYDWSRIAGFKATAKTVPGGMIDLSVGSPVDPVPSSVQQALVAGADAPNAHGYPVTAGTADLKASNRLSPTRLTKSVPNLPAPPWSKSMM